MNRFEVNMPPPWIFPIHSWWMGTGCQPRRRAVFEVPCLTSVFLNSDPERIEARDNRHKQWIRATPGFRSFRTPQTMAHANLPRALRPPSVPARPSPEATGQAGLRRRTSEPCTPRLAWRRSYDRIGGRDAPWPTVREGLQPAQLRPITGPNWLPQS